MDAANAVLHRRPRGCAAGLRRRAHTRSRGCRPSHAASAGSSLIEFSLAAIPVLLAGLGAMEVAQWLFVKQAVSLALIEAARAGATQHASPQAIETAFERALEPLYASASSPSPQVRMRLKFAQRSAATGQPPWQIEVISPSARAFDDFSDPALDIARQTGLPAINNSYQAEQDQRLRAKGWIDGLGPLSHLSIYQANTLVLRATYLHEPLIPGMKGLIRMLSGGTDSYSSIAMARGGYLPLVQEAALTMQSDPVRWPAQDNKIIAPRPASPEAQADVSGPCHGIWCLEAAPTQARADAGPPELPAMTPYPTVEQTEPTGDAGGQYGAVPAAPADDTSWKIPELPASDPGCGTTLCCVPAGAYSGLPGLAPPAG